MKARPQLHHGSQFLACSMRLLGLRHARFELGVWNATRIAPKLVVPEVAVLGEQLAPFSV